MQQRDQEKREEAAANIQVSLLLNQGTVRWKGEGQRTRRDGAEAGLEWPRLRSG